MIKENNNRRYVIRSCSLQKEESHTPPIQSKRKDKYYPSDSTGVVLMFIVQFIYKINFNFFYKENQQIYTRRLDSHKEFDFDLFTTNTV